MPSRFAIWAVIVTFVTAASPMAVQQQVLSPATPPKSGIGHPSLAGTVASTNLHAASDTVKLVFTLPSADSDDDMAPVLTNAWLPLGVKIYTRAFAA